MKRIINCDKCKKDFVQKWIIPKQNWSQINQVSYWTEGKSWGDFKTLCRGCLKEWFEYYREDFAKLVKPKKQKLFSNYRGFGLFDKSDYYKQATA